MPRILYVEDHADTREAICEMLRRAGFDIDGVENGREALEYVIDTAPDVLLLDLALPEMDGIELVHVLRSYLRLSTIPVIVLSALANSPLLDEARALNVNSVLIKGDVTFDQILSAIRIAMAQPPSARRFLPDQPRPGDAPPIS